MKCVPTPICRGNASNCPTSQDAAAPATSKAPKQHQKTPAAARDKQPDPMFHAYNVKHTVHTYPNRYHPLSNLLQSSSRSETAVLQPVQAAEQADSPLPGVAMLVHEHPELQSDLVLQPSGNYMLSEAAMKRAPQNGRAWQLLRLQCLTASSCHIFLGFHEAVAANVFIAAKQRNHHHLERAAHQLLNQSSMADLHASTAGNHKAFPDWGHDHEANAIETFLQHYPEAHVYQQSYQILRELPPQLADKLCMTDLPVLGASPDAMLMSRKDSIG